MIKETYVFDKQMKNSVRYKPTENSLLQGMTVYLPLRVIKGAPPKKINIIVELLED